MKCYCVCHSEHASRAWCEHCNGENEVNWYHRRRQHWYYRWPQNLVSFLRDLRFIMKYRRIPANWFMSKYKPPV